MPQDLLLWRECHEADLIHGASDRLKRLTEAAVLEIESYTTERATYAAVSWGKDSTVLAHLMWLTRPSIPMIYVRAVPTANPDCILTRDAFLSRFPVIYHEHVADYSALSQLLTMDDRNIETDRIFFEVCNQVRTKYGSPMMGIRASESRVRRYRVGKGLSMESSCCPIGRWTVQDVFGYLAHHRLPVNPVYAMLGGGRWKRHDLRTDELGGAPGSQFGRTEWEQEYYRDEMNRLSRWPR